MEEQQPRVRNTFDCDPYIGMCRCCCTVFTACYVCSFGILSVYIDSGKHAITSENPCFLTRVLYDIVKHFNLCDGIGQTEQPTPDVISTQPLIDEELTPLIE